MRIPTVPKVAAGLILLAVSVFAADVNGKWTATVQGRNGNSREVTYNFKADGEKLTGTMSSPMGDREIENGKITGDDISFTMTMNMGGESRKMMYTGKVSAEELKLTMKSEGGEFTRDISAKRAK